MDYELLDMIRMVFFTSSLAIMVGTGFRLGWLIADSIWRRFL